MLFNVTTAKKEILRKLSEQDWTPTDLAEELERSRNTIYNHLTDLHEQGVLTKKKVAAKTRPKTEYSIGDGFMQYVTVLPGKYTEKTVELTPRKQAVLRIWDIPQEEFQPFVESYWWGLKNNADIDYREDLKAVAVYGSVARGQADDDSDIDFLVITDDEEAEEVVTDTLGSVRLKAEGSSKIGMTETYSAEEYRNSLAHSSDFLEKIQDELHVIYDPDRYLRNPKEVLKDEF
jgi:predicted nucleotidyltransferase/DNA-binding HxlR family transcriptional regulator